MSPASRWKRLVALTIAFLSATINFAITIPLVSLWHFSKNIEVESEWEGLASAWVKGLNALGGLAVIYFLASAAANIVGFVGMIRRNSRCVRFWRDFSIADLACSTTATIFVVYASSRYVDLRNGICEELSRHDSIMMDLAEMGITLENCEQWSQRVVFASVFLLVIIHLIRLYVVITVSKIITRMTPHGHHRRSSSNMKRIYLLPSLPGSSQPTAGKASEQVVYAPIPLSQLTDRDRSQLSAREVWVATDPSIPRPQGRITLPIQPGEGLLSSSQEK